MLIDLLSCSQPYVFSIHILFFVKNNAQTVYFIISGADLTKRVGISENDGKASDALYRLRRHKPYAFTTEKLHFTFSLHCFPIGRRTFSLESFAKPSVRQYYDRIAKEIRRVFYTAVSKLSLIFVHVLLESRRRRGDANDSRR